MLNAESRNRLYRHSFALLAGSGVNNIMVTRRNDARRRRVLSEEFIPTDEAAVAENNKPMVAYTFGANRRNQPKTTDLIPKRSLALSLFFALLVGIVAAINAFAWYGVPLAEILGEESVRSLALFGPGTLANWFCTVCLLLCAGICLQLFLMRKHKRDDYGGMYRVWILMSAMFVLASIDCAIDLRTITAKLFGFLTLRSLLQTPWLLMTIEMIVLGIIVIRMLYEVRTSKFSLAAVLLVWLGFVGCIVLRNTEVPASIAWLDQKTAYGNCILLGCVGSLAALTIYARFVFLHAHGLIKQKVKISSSPAVEIEQAETTSTKPARSKKKKTKAADPPAQVVDQPTATERPASKAKANAAASPLAQKQRQAKAAKTQTTPAAPTPQQIAADQLRKATAQKKALAEQQALAKQKAAAREQALAQQQAAQQKAAAQVAAQKAAVHTDDESEETETIPMSKAERRRQRKLAKRAARAKKAA